MPFVDDVWEEFELFVIPMPLLKISLVSGFKAFPLFGL